MQTPIDVLKDIVSRLESKKIDYFLVGSLASMYYGQLRYTNDVDLVLQISPAQIAEFTKLFPIEKYYCPPVEVLRDEVIRQGQFNLIHQESQIKVDVVLAKQTEFYKSELSRKKRVKVSQDFEVYIASPEDIIIKKLDFYREGESEKHLTDIRGILAETDVDQGYIDAWVQKMGLQNEWKKI